MTDDANLPLKVIAQRVFFETEEIEDVLEMISNMIQPIFAQRDDMADISFNLGGLDRNGANGTVMLKTNDGNFGISGFMIKRNGTLIDGHSMASNMFDAYNLNSRDGLMAFSVRLYEDVAQNLISNAAAKRFERRWGR